MFKHFTKLFIQTICGKSYSYCPYCLPVFFIPNMIKAIAYDTFN